jgi:hypothetical protein
VDGRKGIKTTVVCPFFVKTPLFAGIESKYKSWNNINWIARNIWIFFI